MITWGRSGSRPRRSGHGGKDNGGKDNGGKDNGGKDNGGKDNGGDKRRPDGSRGRIRSLKFETSTTTLPRSCEREACELRGTAAGDCR